MDPVSTQRIDCCPLGRVLLFGSVQLLLLILLLEGLRLRTHAAQDTVTVVLHTIPHSGYCYCSVAHHTAFVSTADGCE